MAQINKMRASNASKPLYQYEKQLSYQRHLKKLEEIRHRTGKKSRNTIKEMRKIWENSEQVRKRKNRSIQSQNQKILDKLLSISTRTITQSMNNSKPKTENVQRKKLMIAIKKENQHFGSKLMHLRSSLEYSRVTKSMEKYQEVKQRMFKNKRARLPQLSYNFTRKHKDKSPFSNLKIRTSQDHTFKDIDDIRVIGI